ncbi:MAG: hypothetical protein AAGA03_04525 [Planctomycetota bacterium]
MSSAVDSDSRSTAPISSVAARIAAIAQAASNRPEFLKRLAEELAEQVNATLIAVSPAPDQQPIMLVVDPLSAQAVGRPSLTAMLHRALPSVTACDLAMEESHNRSVDVAASAQLRGLTVELSPAPQRSAMVVVLAPSATGPKDQIASLKIVSGYASAVRDHWHQDANAQAMQEERRLTQQGSGPALIGDHDVPSATDSPGEEADSSALAARSDLRSFHRSLDSTATAYRIANAATRLLGAERAMVLLPQGRSMIARAVSGALVVDRRSSAVRAAQQLADRAVVLGRPLLSTEDRLDLPPQVSEALDDYLDANDVSDCIAIGLVDHEPSGDDPDDRLDAPESHTSSGKASSGSAGRGELQGMLLLEWFAGDSPKQLTAAISVVANEAVLALRNARQHERIFGRRLLTAIGRLVPARVRGYVWAGLVIAIALLVASFWIQVDHTVVATGTLQLRQQRHVYAPVDGVVREVLVSDGQEVLADAPVIKLDAPDLRARHDQVSGEIQTLATRLASISSQRLAGLSDPSQVARLAAEVGQVDSELENARRRLAILDQQMQQLTLVAPISGTVIGWRLDQRLANRPVARGNQLLSIADPAGEWTLQLTVPDRQSGAVISALKQREELEVRFAVATLADQTFDARLCELATAARLDHLGDYVVDAQANVPHDSLASVAVIPGAEVTAHIRCQPRSLLSSWFSDAIDFFHRHVLFRLR